MSSDTYYLAITAYTDIDKFPKVNADAIEEGQGVDLNPSDSFQTTSSRAPTVDIPIQLVLRKLPRNGRAYSFGRSPDSDVVLPCSSTSRKHFFITLNDRLDCWILHAHSRTIVDGYELPEKERTVTALKFDTATTITVPGFILHVEPRWIAEVQLDYHNLSGFADLKLESDNGTQTITQTWDAVESSEEPKAKPTYHMLQRVAWRNARYVQEMSSGQLLVAEEVSCEKKAKEALSWRRDIYDKHCPRAVDVYTEDGSTFLIVEAPKPFWQLEDLTEWDSFNPILQRTAFAFLFDLLRTIEYLYMHRICHGAIGAENIMVASLHDSDFVLANLSYASRAAETIEKHHQADVAKVLQTVSEACPNLFLGDPVAHTIFNDLQARIKSEFVSSEEVRHAFDAFTLRGIPEFPFISVRFDRNFPLRRMESTCYRKSELAAFARAHLTQDIFEAWRIHEQIMQIKAVRDVPNTFGDLVDWRAGKSALRSLDTPLDFAELSTVRARSFDLRFEITKHRDLDLWNISQLLVARRSEDILDIKPLKGVCILGEKSVNGLYVDAQTFASVCNSMEGLRQVCPIFRTVRLADKVVPTRGPCTQANQTPEMIPTQSMKRKRRPEKLCLDNLRIPPTRGKRMFIPADDATSPSPAIDLTASIQLSATYLSSLEQRNAILLADRRLLTGIATFDLASRTMNYVSKTFSKRSTLRVCEEYGLNALKFGIEQSRDPGLDAVLYGEFVIDFYASEHESTTASYRSSLRLSRLKNRGKFEDEDTETEHSSSRVEEADRTEEWVAEHTNRKRKRYLRPIDIVPMCLAGKRGVEYSIRNDDGTESTQDQASSGSRTSRANTIRGEPTHSTYLLEHSPSDRAPEPTTQEVIAGETTQMTYLSGHTPSDWDSTLPNDPNEHLYGVTQSNPSDGSGSLHSGLGV